jgi:hypothetical protein
MGRSNQRWLHQPITNFNLPVDRETSALQRSDRVLPAREHLPLRLQGA